LVIEHNTHFQVGNTMVFYGQQTSGFVYRNNITRLSGYGIFGDGVGSGKAALTAYCPGYEFLSNIIIGASKADYPGNNFYPRTMSEVGFVDFARGDFKLNLTSPYKNRGTGRRDPGSDFEALKAKVNDYSLTSNSK